MLRRFLYIAPCVTLAAAGLVSAGDHAVPQRVSVDMVPSEFDEFGLPRGNIRVTFRDKHTEVWTHRGDCRDPRVSPRGDVGWVRAEKTSIDRPNMRASGTDFLNLRLRDGTSRQLSPLEDVPDGRFIEEWRFADGGVTVVVRAHGYHGPSFYVKYDVQTGRVLDDVGTYRPYSKLPAWAKRIASESSRNE